MIKKLQYLLVCIGIFTIAACSSKNNDITNPTKDDVYNNNNNNNAKIITTSYTINGIDEKYSGTWKFFNADDTGNNAVDITIKDGGVSGLVISNNKAKNISIAFKKENIYSRPKKEDNQYYDRYFGYIISDGIWVGEIHFPIYDDETVGYVYVTNKNTSEIIIGMIDKAPGAKEGIENSFIGTFNADNNKSVNIAKDFVTYSENGKVKSKIPASFLELSRDDKNYLGYTVFYGPLYSGVFINTSNTKIIDPVNELNFIYIDYNYKLEIILREDGVPISARYNKKITTISADNLIYAK